MVCVARAIVAHGNAECAYGVGTRGGELRKTGSHRSRGRAGVNIVFQATHGKNDSPCHAVQGGSALQGVAEVYVLGLGDGARHIRPDCKVSVK